MDIARVYTICKEMMIQRGYTDVVTKNMNEHTEYLEAFDRNATEQEDDFTSTSNKIAIIFSHHSKLGVKLIIPLLKFMENNDYKRGIIIYINITSKSIKATSSSSILVELFHHEELMFNITKHVLFPKHIKLSKEESTEFKKKHGSLFPIIKSTDPVARFYFFQKGDIIKIVHKSGFVSYDIVR
jgi:DNA-directed RNA polymerases I, II, and III subunit RPABC1